MAAGLDEPRGRRDAFAELVLLGPHQGAGLDQRGLGGGAAHVEGDGIGGTDGLAETGSADHPRRRPGTNEKHRPAAGFGDAGGAAVGGHHQQRGCDPEPGEASCQLVEIAAHHRQQIGVDHRGAGALVLLDLGQDVDRGRDREVGVTRPDQLGGTALVSRREVAVEKTDGEGLDAGGDQLVGGRQHAGLVQGQDHTAIGGDPLAHLQPVAAWNQGGRLVPGEIVEIGGAHPADLQNVAKATGGQQPGDSALALQDGVGADRGAMQDLGHGGSRHTGGLQNRADALDHRPGRLAGGRGHLVHQHPTVGTGQHDVGERSPDVDRQPRRQPAQSRLPYPPPARPRRPMVIFDHRHRTGQGPVRAPTPPTSANRSCAGIAPPGSAGHGLAPGRQRPMQGVVDRHEPCAFLPHSPQHRKRGGKARLRSLAYVEKAP